MKKDCTYIKLFLLLSKVINPRCHNQILFRQILDIQFILVVFIVSLDPVDLAQRLLLLLQVFGS